MLALVRNFQTGFEIIFLIFGEINIFEGNYKRWEEVAAVVRKWKRMWVTEELRYFVFARGQTYVMKKEKEIKRKIF